MIGRIVFWYIILMWIIASYIWNNNKKIIFNEEEVEDAPIVTYMATVVVIELVPIIFLTVTGLIVIGTLMAIQWFQVNW